MKRIVIILLAIIAINTKSAAQATFSAEAGIYSTLLKDLKYSLNEKSRIKTLVLDGKERLMFVEWIRDHIHTMKAYKYWQKDMSSYIDFILGRQTPKGMYFDYCESYKNKNVGQLFFVNVFDNQFYYVDVKDQLFFFRMPIEADLEYLVVEGAFTNWQTTGDTVFLHKCIPQKVK